MKNKIIVTWILIIFGPFAFVTTYLLISRWPIRWFTTASDLSALIGALLVGLKGLHMLPWSTWVKAITAALYILVAGVIIGYYSLLFVCAFFGDCL